MDLHIKSWHTAHINKYCTELLLRLILFSRNLLMSFIYQIIQQSYE